MSSSKSFAFQPTHSQQTSPATSLDSVRLTTSEIESLRQSKRLISAYVQKELQGSLGAKLELLKKKQA